MLFATITLHWKMEGSSTLWGQAVGDASTVKKVALTDCVHLNMNLLYPLIHMSALDFLSDYS
ncbi:hypothetical protein OESDEN_04113 [Oesophagostomum dentatum]|uniref:Uncharacterized protein n=1 Tax=Oesophagostomum dentatum TaxID=61180 RepID=A0A0B1TEE0_OESDE|nr:hypothetical protein OESDEN_04113 [Oesophagostomum dentatum]